MRADDRPALYEAEAIDLNEPIGEWDSFVEAAPGGDLVQTSMWGLSKRAIGQTPALVVVRGSNGRIKAGALLVERRIAPGFTAAYVARGPVVGEYSRELLAATLDAVITTARGRRLSGLIVQLPEGADEQEPALQEAGFIPGSLAVAPEATIRVDIRQSDEAIVAQMKAGNRRRLKKSLRDGFDVVDVVASDDVEAFHRLHLATASRQGFSALSLSYLTEQWRALAPVGFATILLAQRDGQPLAGLWLTRFRDVVTSRISGWDKAACGPEYTSEALDWAAINWARQSGASFYDFGGFDRCGAERLLDGEPLPSGFEKTHHYYKLGWSSVPILFPRAHFRMLNSAANTVARTFAPQLLQHPLVRRVGQRLRSG